METQWYLEGIDKSCISSQCQLIRTNQNNVQLLLICPQAGLRLATLRLTKQCWHLPQTYAWYFYIHFDLTLGKQKMKYWTFQHNGKFRTILLRTRPECFGLISSVLIHAHIYLHTASGAGIIASSPFRMDSRAGLRFHKGFVKYFYGMKNNVVLENLQIFVINRYFDHPCLPDQAQHAHSRSHWTTCSIREKKNNYCCKWEDTG